MSAAWHATIGFSGQNPVWRHVPCYVPDPQRGPQYSLLLTEQVWKNRLSEAQRLQYLQQHLFTPARARDIPGLYALRASWLRDSRDTPVFQRRVLLEDEQEELEVKEY